MLNNNEIFLLCYIMILNHYKYIHKNDTARSVFLKIKWVSEMINFWFCSLPHACGLGHARARVCLLYGGLTCINLVSDLRFGRSWSFIVGRVVFWCTQNELQLLPSFFNRPESGPERLTGSGWSFHVIWLAGHSVWWIVGNRWRFVFILTQRRLRPVIHLCRSDEALSSFYIPEGEIK